MHDIYDGGAHDDDTANNIGTFNLVLYVYDGGVGGLDLLNVNVDPLKLVVHHRGHFYNLVRTFHDDTSSSPSGGRRQSA